MSLISPILKKNTQIINKIQSELLQKSVSETFKSLNADASAQINIFVKKTQKTCINENFIMVIQETENVICQILTNAEFKVFGFMRSFTKYENEIHVDIKVIADSLLMSDRSVKSAIHKLSDLNIIKIKSDLMDRRRNFYILNPQSSWKGIEEKRKQIITSVFNAEPGLKINQLNKDLRQNLQTQLYLPLE